jgi:hypothetical protein
MTKADKMSDFEGDTITKVEEVSPRSQEQKFDKWKKENAVAIRAARESFCVCSPTRAELLLIDQADGIEQIE